MLGTVTAANDAAAGGFDFDQISFHTARALTTLSFVKGSEVQDEK